MRKDQGRGLFLLVLVCGLAIITGVWYLTSDGDEEAAAPAVGGDYVEGMTGAPARVNPLFASENAADQTLVSLVFAGLTRLDDRGLPFPDLASTWDVSPDGLTYTIRLRSGLLWQDGEPLTADDVVFTYALLQDPSLTSAPPLAPHLEGASVTARDPSTVVIELPQPFAPLPAYLSLGILPKHLLEGQTVEQIRDSLFNQQPVGSGPYRLDHLMPGRADLAANPAYYLPQPFIQNLQIRFYHDEGELFSALENGEIGGALFHNPLGEAQALSIARDDHLRLLPLSTGAVTSVFLNLDEPVFADRRVRQALLYALDRAAIIKQTLGGMAQTADSPLPPASWAYSPALARYQTDSEQAALLLEDAGWHLDADGVRRRDGQALSFKLSTTTDPVLVAVAQSLAVDWQAIGVQVSIDQQGLTPLVRDIIESRSYQALLLSDAPRLDPDPYDRWHSATPEGGDGNLSGLADDGIDALLEQARAAPYTTRKELYERFQELFAQEVPSIPLYASMVPYVQSAALQGARLGLVSQPGDRFWQVQDWFLKTE